MTLRCCRDIAKYVNCLSKKDRGDVYDEYVKAEFMSDSSSQLAKIAEKERVKMRNAWEKRQIVGEKILLLMEGFSDGIFSSLPSSKILSPCLEGSSSPTYRSLLIKSIPSDNFTNSVKY